MIIKCAWCGKYMGEKEPLENKNITHGICLKCLKKQLIISVPEVIKE